jgi:Chromo (CHRromatin Organisation MOdifier) domain
VQYGREAFLPIDRVMGAASNTRVNTAHPAVSDLHEDIEEVLKAVRGNVKRAQETQKKHFDKNRKDAETLMDVGQQVFMRKRTVEFAGTSVKLQRPWAGPYRVVEKISDLNRVIQHVNNPEQRITVHISQLKPFVASQDTEGTQRHEDEFEVQEIVGEQRHKGKTKYRVRWAGHTKKHDGWVAEEDMKADELLGRWKHRALEKRTVEAEGWQLSPSGGRRRKGQKQHPRKDGRVAEEKGKQRLPLGSPKDGKAHSPTQAKTTSRGRQVQIPGRFRFSALVTAGSKDLGWLEDDPGNKGGSVTCVYNR